MDGTCRTREDRRTFFHRGAAVLTCRFPRLESADPAAWGGVCERSARTVEAFLSEAEAVLLPLAAADYDADPSPRKRFSPARVRLEVTCRASSPAAGILCLRWRVTLARPGRPASVRVWGETYAEGGAPLPPRIALGRRALREAAKACHTAARRLARADWYADGGSLHFFWKGGEATAPRGEAPLRRPRVRPAPSRLPADGPRGKKRAEKGKKKRKKTVRKQEKPPLFDITPCIWEK